MQCRLTRVILTKDFLIGKYASDTSIVGMCDGYNPSGHTDCRKPVGCVSWLDCVTFCNTLSEQEGLTPVYINDGNVECNWEANGYRLPTESEWEYSAYGERHAGFFDDVDLYAVSDHFSGPEAVGPCPNERGLYDMTEMLKSGAGMDTTRILHRMQQIQEPLLLNLVLSERLGVEVTPQSHGLLEYPTENGLKILG